MNITFLKNEGLDLENVTIETPRCVIKPFQVEGVDFEDLALAFCIANENLFVSEQLPNAEQEKVYISETIDKLRNGKVFECFVYGKESNTIIGAIGINSVDSDEPNLGLWIRKEYHGKGYGKEVYKAMVDWAKQETNFKFLKHATDPKNNASIRLAEHFQGRLQETLTNRGHLKYYIMLNNENSAI